jgi:hypothetical protein
VPRLDRAGEVRGAATKLVSSAFVLPMLGAMRQSAFRPTEGPFAAGIGEQRFAPLLDQHLADGIVQAQHFTLVDGIVDRLTRSSPRSGT